MSQSPPLTPRGLAKLQQQLQHLREVERPKNVRDIEEARAHGDLRENAEYHAAKERQAMIAGTMQMLETTIATAHIIDPATLSGSRVVFGATVTVTDIDTEQQVVYQIVGDAEADLQAGLISISAPIARSLIGREVGDEITMVTPGGKKSYCIDKLEFK